MKYFLDCEFMEDGKSIELLSLALVREDARELYLVNTSADRSRANPWVRENVIPQLDQLPPDSVIGTIFAHVPHSDIGPLVQNFIERETPEFWGYYAAYDWVALCQCFGAMVNLPKGYPMFCRDLIQEAKRTGNPDLPPQGKGEHHALLDARWNRATFDYLRRRQALGIV